MSRNFKQVAFAAMIALTTVLMLLIASMAFSDSIDRGFLMVVCWILLAVHSLSSTYLHWNSLVGSKGKRSDDSESEPEFTLSESDANYVPMQVAQTLESPITQRLLMLIDSQNDEIRTQALQKLMKRFHWPVGKCELWPGENSTLLQQTTAEIMFREWLEIVRASPFSTENSVIEQLFPSADSERRYRRLAEINRDVSVVKNAIDDRLDRLSDAVKDTILDMMPDHAEPRTDSDVALAPMPREEFLNHVRPKVEEVLEHMADTLATSNTEEDLIRAEAEIHPFLSNLRWEAIAAALELRLPPQDAVTPQDVESRAGSLLARKLPPESPQPKPDESWVKKFRRMRAAGMQ